MVQWLGLRAFTGEGPGFNPGRESKIPQARVAKSKNTLLLKKKKKMLSPSSEYSMSYGFFAVLMAKSTYHHDKYKIKKKLEIL